MTDKNDKNDNEELSDLERILGGKLERLDNGIIPGLYPVAGQNAIYYQDDKRVSPDRIFKLLLEGVLERRAKLGGRSSHSCAILTPDSQLFSPTYYHGDREG